jgi:outer membrane receptor protein involved in Fe transport
MKVGKLFLILCLAVSQYSQGQTEPDDSTMMLSGSLEEVVVSTQKREQSKIEVPVTVSALSRESIIRLDIRYLDELSEYIPGMQMLLQSPNNPGYVIRGVTSNDGDSRSQHRASVFLDEVSISRTRGSVVELFDLERIEVLRDSKNLCSVGALR